MDSTEKSIIEAGERGMEVIRESKQPRIADKSIDQIFWSVYTWIKNASMNEPPYSADSRVRDKWLRSFSKKEPLLGGILSNVISIDKNRGWTMEGGARQVEKYTNILHNAENGQGWRYFMSMSSEAFYCSDIGWITEVERSVKPREGAPLPPMTNLYFVDPTNCKLRPKNKLTYYPPNRPKQDWEAYDFFRICSMPSTNEQYWGLGYSAVSRCIDLAKILIAIWEHDMEKLGAKAPRGLLLLKNISEAQWDTAMETRKEKLSDYEQEFYSNIATLATEGPDEIDAKLLALSNMPEMMNRQEVVNATMYAYALEFEYDPREFWPVSGGAIGTATETEVQHRKATGKGGMDFALLAQENIQKNLPASINFEFDQRDVAGEQEDVSLMQAKITAIAAAATITTVTAEGRPSYTIQEPQPQEMGEIDRGALEDAFYAMVQPKGGQGEVVDAPPGDTEAASPGVATSTGSETALTRDEVRILLAEAGVIPHEWTEYQEDIQTTDKETNQELEELRSKLSIQRAATLFPNEPIIRYSWPSGQMKILFREGNDVFHRKSYPVAKIRSQR